MGNLIGGKMVKTAKKYNRDERREEFVEATMNALNGNISDKPWWGEVNFCGPLLALALFTFDGAKVFRRTVGPMMEKYIEAGIFLYREEERIQRVMGEALDASGLKENYKKKAMKHLGASFDEQHFKAPYKTVGGETEAIGYLKAFIKGWMDDFCQRAWDILENGIGKDDNGSSRDEKVLFATVVFQAL